MQWLRIAVFASAFSFALAGQDTHKSVRGCLHESEGGFTLATDGDSLDLTGNVDFIKHVGHMVEVTGEQKGDHFAVESLTHIAPSCEAAGRARGEPGPNG